MQAGGSRPALNLRLVSQRGENKWLNTEDGVLKMVKILWKSSTMIFVII